MKQWTTCAAIAAVAMVCVSALSCGHSRIGKSEPINGLIYNGAYYTRDRAFAVGESGETAYSYDGGKTWTKGDNASRCLFTLDVIDQDTCIAAGHGQDVVITTDAGKTWRHCTDIGSELGKLLSFIDRNNGWAAGRSWLGVTNDGCVTWTKLTYPKAATCIEAIAMTGLESGFLLANTGLLFKTDDAGTTWNEVTRIYSKEDASFTYAPGQMNGTAAMRIIGNKGLCVCSGMSGTKSALLIYSTADGGATWKKEDFLYPEVPAMSVTISRDFIVSIFDVSTRVSAWQY